MRLGSNIKRLIAGTAVAALASVGTAATTAHADISGNGYYRPAHSDVIYRYFNYGSGINGWHALTAEQWAQLGHPTPAVVGSDIVKYPWSPTVYAVTYFHDDWLWERLSFEAWSRIGQPAPRHAGWIAGSLIYQYGSSPELFLIGEDGVGHRLTYDEWAATGFHPVTVRQHNFGFVQDRGNPAIYAVANFGQGGAEVRHQLSFQEWVAFGSPTPQLRG